MKIFHVGSHQFRESLRELLRELWFSYCSSRGMPFREWNFVFREWNFEFRELLREYPGTLRELREWPFHSESVFPEIGVVPSSKFRRRLEVGEVSSKHTCFLSVLEPDFSQLFFDWISPSPVGFFQSFGMSLCNRSQVPEAFSMISL